MDDGCLLLALGHGHLSLFLTGRVAGQLLRSGLRGSRGAVLVVDVVIVVLSLATGEAWTAEKSHRPSTLNNLKQRNAKGKQGADNGGRGESGPSSVVGGPANLYGKIA